MNIPDNNDDLRIRLEQVKYPYHPIEGEGAANFEIEHLSEEWLRNPDIACLMGAMVARMGDDFDHTYWCDITTQKLLYQFAFIGFSKVFEAHQSKKGLDSDKPFGVGS